MRNLLVSLSLLAACASSSGTTASLAPPPAAQEASALAAQAPEEPVDFPGHPTLVQVLERAQLSPVLLAARASVAREQGARRQAGLFPNPVLKASTQEFDVDDLAKGPGVRRIGIWQRFEIGGKRSARKEMAGERILEAEAGERFQHLEVARAAARAHQEALSAQDLAALREEALKASRELLSLQQQLARTGRARETSVVPLQVLVGQLRVDLQLARNRHRTALRRLEGILSLPARTIEGVMGDLLDPEELPAPDAPDLLDLNPEVASRRAAEETAVAGVRQAESLAVPDVTLGLAYQEGRFITAEEGAGLGIFLELPLPVMDRNQGGIAAAEAEVRRTQALTRDSRIRIESAYAEQLEEVKAFRANRDAYREDIVPARERLLDLARASFESGRNSRTELLETQLALLRSRAELSVIERGIALGCVDALTLLGRHPEEWGS
ncbi:MAG: TolC family protein [Planctomycetota bacterium]|jgi:cobalt-zinc-cadmium efflux system outer membrane protein